jgi:hypothetical protein
MARALAIAVLACRPGLTSSLLASLGHRPMSIVNGSRHQFRYGADARAGRETGWFKDVTVVPGAEDQGTDVAGAASNVAPITLVRFPRTTLSFTPRPAGRRRRA